MQQMMEQRKQAAAQMVELMKRMTAMHQNGGHASIGT